MEFDRLQTKMNEAFQELLEDEGIEQLTDEQMARWPLDPRARPYHMYANEYMLCVPVGAIRMLDYYGGFEYVDSDNRMQIGDWVVFSTESDRVRQVVEAMLEIDIDC